MGSDGNQFQQEKAKYLMFPRGWSFPLSKFNNQGSKKRTTKFWELFQGTQVMRDVLEASPALKSRHFPALLDCFTWYGQTLSQADGLL